MPGPFTGAIGLPQIPAQEFDLHRWCYFSRRAARPTWRPYTAAESGTGRGAGPGHWNRHGAAWLWCPIGEQFVAHGGQQREVWWTPPTPLAAPWVQTLTAYWVSE